MSDMAPPHVLFVCTGNAGRSQIAHALAKRCLGRRAVIESAGVEPWDDLHPMTRRVLAARGVSVEGHHPKSAVSVSSHAFDFVVTIGGLARDRLPDALRGSRWLHWDLADPADADGTDRSEAVFVETAARIERLLPEVVALVDRWQGPSLRWRAGIGTGLWSRDGFEPRRHVPAAAAAGFSAIELNLLRPDDFDAHDPAALDELQRVLADYSITVASIHAPDGGHLGAAQAKERERQVDILRWSVELAGRLGATTVVSHALLLLGDNAPPDEPATDERIAESLVTLAPEVDPLPVRIAFENGRGNQPGAFAADVLRRLDAHSRAAFGFALDTGHANIAGDWSTIAHRVGADLISLHLNDNDSVQDAHLPPGRGNVDWLTVRWLLEETRFGGCLMYEILPGDEPVELRLRQTADWHHRWTTGRSCVKAEDEK